MPVLRPPPEPNNEQDAKIDKAEQVKRAKKKKLEDEERKKKKKKKNVIVDPGSKDKGQFSHLKGLKEVRRRKKGKSDLSFLLHHETKEERSNFVSFTRKKRVKYSTTKHLLRYTTSCLYTQQACQLIVDTLGICCQMLDCLLWFW